MSKKNQVVKVEYTSENYGIFRSQEITDIVTDEEGYAFGLWKDKLVGAFSVKNDTWFVI